MTPTTAANPTAGVKRRLLVVALFAAAMAWVESAAVFYLRRLVDRIEPYQPNPFPVAGDIGGTELVRELATIIMLLAVGWLAGRTWRARLGYFLVGFGVWDVLYYAFLRVISGWPHSLLDWDILFLIPLPWWGPVLAPMLIAALMIVGGALLADNDEHEARPRWPPAWAQVVGTLGVLLALDVFMADAIRAVRQGSAVQQVLPQAFNWPLFLVSWAFIAVAVATLQRHRR